MKYLKYAIALAITTACLYLAFRNVDFGRAWEIVTDTKRLRILPLAGFSGISLLVMWIRGWRWKYFYLPQHHATTGGMTTANLIGFTVNNILPFRLGEAVRALVARRKVDAPLSYVLATVVIERIFDSISLLICLVIPLAYTETFPPAMIKISQVMFYLLVGSVILLILMGYKPRAAEKGVVKLTSLFLPEHVQEKVAAFMGTFSKGMEILRKWDVLLKVSVLSVFHWGIIAYSYYLAIIGFGFSGLPWTAPFLTLGLVGMSVALPSAPAYIGPVHAAVIYSLNGVYGQPQDGAAAFAVVMHLLMIVPVTVAGFIAMAREGMSLGQLRRRAEHIEEDNQAAPQAIPAD